MRTVAIIGFGRFGKTLYRLLKEDFAITIFNRNELTPDEKNLLDKNTKVARNLQEAYASNVIFFAVPIPSFENVIKEHKKYFTSQHILIDVLSVKTHPQNVFKKYLKNTKTQAILTHPMFGPDSSKNGFEGLPMIMDKFLASETEYSFWKNFFMSKKLRVVEISPQEHDKLAANSQGVTHFIGRVLDEFKLSSTPIDSLGAKKLQEIREQTCNDTWELFYGLQAYNPYTKSMRLRLGKAYDKLYNKLLLKRVNKKHWVFGIQGGVGSFNEQALQIYIKEKNITKFAIKYLYTTDKVLKKLYEGDIDFGIFAIYNSLGGFVRESLDAIPKHKFKIIHELDMQITHVLMKRKDIALNDLSTVMAHPQVLRQCKQTLEKRFSKLKTISGEAELLDTARAAKALAEGDIGKEIAILGPKNLAQKYNFDIVAENLQDSQENVTHFLIVRRI